MTFTTPPYLVQNVSVRHVMLQVLAALLPAIAAYVWLIADSYTHLDVYKRQGQLIGKADKWISSAVHAPTSGTVLAVEERIAAHPSGPVSYTHLDVYKRQVPAWQGFPEKFFAVLISIPFPNGRSCRCLQQAP